MKDVIDLQPNLTSIPPCCWCSGTGICLQCILQGNYSFWKSPQCNGTFCPCITVCSSNRKASTKTCTSNIVGTSPCWPMLVNHAIADPTPLALSLPILPLPYPSTTSATNSHALEGVALDLAKWLWSSYRCAFYFCHCKTLYGAFATMHKLHRIGTFRPDPESSASAH